MKLIMENWKKYLNEGEVIRGPWKSAKDQAIHEFIEIFPDVSAPDEVEAEDFMFHLETKEVEPALVAIGYEPRQFGMDQLGSIYMWVDKWFNKKNNLSKKPNNYLTL